MNDNTTLSVDDLLRACESALELADHKALSGHASAAVTKARDAREVASALQYLGIAQRYLGNLTEALKCFCSALELCDRDSDPATTATLLLNIGSLYAHQGKYRESLRLFHECERLFERADDVQGLANLLGSVGSVYSHLAEYRQALEYQHRSYRLQQECGNRLGEATALNNIGNVLMYTGDPERAEEYYLRALDIFIEVGNKVGAGNALSNLGGIAKIHGDSTLAAERYMKSLDYHESCGYAAGMAITLCRLGDIHREHTRHDEAFAAYEQAAEIVNNHGLADSMAHFQVMFVQASLLATEAWPHHSTDQALALLATARELARQTGATRSEADALREMAQLYKRIGRWEQAYRALEAHGELERIILDEETKRRIAAAEAQRTIEVLQAEKQVIHQKNRELEALNDQLDKANSFKVRMMSVASHDLKNLLTAVVLASENAESVGKVGGDVGIHIARIKKYARYMLSLISDLLDMASLEAGSLRIQRARVDFTKVVCDAVQDKLDAATRKDQRIIFRFDDGCHIEGDPVRLHQIVENLLSNAIKYSPLGKRIWISLERAEQRALLVVRDEGPGFTEEDKTSVFDFFQRLSAKPTGGEVSTGVGLFIVKYLADMHSGTVTLDSTAGSGATFTVDLPIAHSA